MKNAKLSEKYLNEGQYALSTDYWLRTEYAVLDKTYGIDFYNILTEIPYRTKFAHNSKLSTADLRKLGYDLMVLNKRNNLLNRTMYKEARNLESLMNGPVKETLGIPSDIFWGSQSSAVFDALAEDFMKPVIQIVEKLLNETSVEVVVYTGQLDLICSTPATIKWVKYQ
jgi:serine carboxypeptidase 1